MVHISTRLVGYYVDHVSDVPLLHISIANDARILELARWQCTIREDHHFDATHQIGKKSQGYIASQVGGYKEN